MGVYELHGDPTVADSFRHSIPGIKCEYERIELCPGDALFALQTGFLSGMSIVIASDARQSSMPRG